MDRALGALPVVAEYSRRLDLVGIIDRACPVRDVAIVSHGQVIEALIANRLTSPAPMWRVGDWAQEWAVEQALGTDPGALNDDRIARALDAVAPELERIVGSVGAQAISAFGLDVARLHWDMTSVSLYGAYEVTDPDHPAPRFGHPKDRRPDLRQIQSGLAVTGDGAVPVFHRAYAGGAGEVSQVAAAMRACRDLAGPRRFLLVGDSKLVSYSNFAVALGTPPVAAAALVGVIGVASVVGRLVMGAVAERLGRIRTFQACFAVLGASFAIWFAAGSYAVLVVFAAVLGVGYGGWIALQPAVIAERPRGLGGVVGLVYTSGGIGALLGAPVAGVLVDASGGYAWAIAFAGICGIGSFVALLPLGRGDVVVGSPAL